MIKKFPDRSSSFPYLAWCQFLLLVSVVCHQAHLIPVSFEGSQICVDYYLYLHGGNVYSLDWSLFFSSSYLQAIFLIIFLGVSSSVQLKVQFLSWMASTDLDHLGCLGTYVVHNMEYILPCFVCLCSLYRDLIRLLSKRAAMIVCQLISYSCTEW